MRSKKHLNRVARIEILKTYSFNKSCFLSYRGQNLMKPFLYETRLPELSNHIYYKSIGPEIRELWILELAFWILFTVRTSMCC